MAVANTLAYYNTVTIVGVKILIVKASRVKHWYFTKVVSGLPHKLGMKGPVMSNTLTYYRHS